jgi:DNA polymerase alpha-associated DNA helicase A
VDEEKEILGTPVVFFDTAGCEYFERMEGDNDEGSRCNENEATVVKNWVDKLVRLPIPPHKHKMYLFVSQIGAGVQPAQIAVISP